MPVKHCDECGRFLSFDKERELYYCKVCDKKTKQEFVVPSAIETTSGHGDILEDGLFSVKSGEEPMLDRTVWPEDQEIGGKEQVQDTTMVYDANKAYARVGDSDKFVEIGEFDGENFKPTFNFPDKNSVDFVSEFVYESVTPDDLRRILGGLKMAHGGAARFNVFLRRTGDI